MLGLLPPLLAGLGGDMRPGRTSAELMSRWAPWVRWHLLSHFSGDPGPKDGKMIATGGLVVGLKGHPWRAHRRIRRQGRLREGCVGRVGAGQAYGAKGVR